MLTRLNWGHTRYQSGDLKAFISLGAELNDRDEAIEVYYLIVTQGESEKEIFQSTFFELGEACDALNDNYQHFDFIDLVGKSSGSGCDTCAAH